MLRGATVRNRPRDRQRIPGGFIFCPPAGRIVSSQSSFEGAHFLNYRPNCISLDDWFSVDSGHHTTAVSYHSLRSVLIGAFVALIAGGQARAAPYTILDLGTPSSPRRSP